MKINILESNVSLQNKGNNFTQLMKEKIAEKVKQ